MMLGLGIETVCTSQERKLWVPITSAPGAGYYKCVPKYEEPLVCRWFGWGCYGGDGAYGTIQPPVPQIGAPETKEQMTVPGEWTPEQSAEDMIGEYKKELQLYGQQNPNVASIPSWLHETGEELKKPFSLVLIALFGGVLFAVMKD